MERANYYEKGCVVAAYPTEDKDIFRCLSVKNLGDGEKKRFAQSYFFEQLCLRDELTFFPTYKN